MKPTFVALTEPLVLGTPIGAVLVGAATSTVAGGYVILSEGKRLLEPVERILRPGPALALGAAGVYTVLSLGSRFGASRLSPFVYGFVVFSVMLGGYTALVYARGELPSLADHVSRSYVAVGTVGAFRSVMIWIAYALATATAVSIVSQLTVLLDVLVGGTLLKEGDTKQRLLGAVMIVIGVLVAIIV